VDENKDPHLADDPWLTPETAAQRIHCGKPPIYKAIKIGRLRAVRINDRGDIRLKASWFDAHLTALGERR
jgi:excisionase family DNA binding protein